MTAPLSIALAGAGLIGRRHATLVLDSQETRLAGIADPASAARAFAEEMGVPWYRDLGDLLAAERPDGVIIATPNRHHRQHAELSIGQRIPALIEKPLADTAEDAAAIAAAADAARVPVLVGHHRRHNPLIAAAKSVIDSGRLGRLVAVHAQFWLKKPDDYFDADWRRQHGAGPVLINLIHDVDLLRHLCGDVASVQATESTATRGFAVEDTAAGMLTFSSGAVGTLTASDTIPAPWSWELTAGENPAYPHTDQHCYLIGGTDGSLSLPQGIVWRHPHAQSWWAPIEPESLAIEHADPLPRQLAHFCAVIRGQVAPLVSAHEGHAAVQVIEALKEAAKTGQRVPISR